MLPCVNPQCNRTQFRETPSRPTRLCKPCRNRLTMQLVPTCGLIPSPTLGVLAGDLQLHLKPTPSEQSDAVRLVRGSRHRQGPWQGRPMYSAAVVHAYAPKPKMSRRMPEFLIGRRRQPNPTGILAAYVHYQLALSVLGIGKQAALYLAGATFFGRRALIRPKGVRREYRGRVVRNAYYLNFEEFVAIGRLAIKAAAILGANKRHAPQIAASYLLGVEAGRYNPPIVVHPLSGITSSSGDHPLDVFLPHPELTPSLPRFHSKIRRSSGKICGRSEYPVGLDVSLEEQAAQRKTRLEADRNRNSIQMTEAASTAWLFT